MQKIHKYVVLFLLFLPDFSQQIDLTDYQTYEKHKDVETWAGIWLRS